MKKEKIVKQTMDTNGYFNVKLKKDGIEKSFPVHFLVAQAFVPNPNNLPYVRHKNGIKTDNRAENLEWTNSIQ